MKQRKRIYYSPEQKALIWDRYKQGCKIASKWHFITTSMKQKTLSD